MSDFQKRRNQEHKNEHASVSSLKHEKKEHKTFSSVRGGQTAGERKEHMAKKMTNPMDKQVREAAKSLAKTKHTSWK